MTNPPATTFKEYVQSFSDLDLAKALIVEACSADNPSQAVQAFLLVSADNEKDDVKRWINEELIPVLTPLGFIWFEAAMERMSQLMAELKRGQQDSGE